MINFGISLNGGCGLSFAEISGVFHFHQLSMRDLVDGLTHGKNISYTDIVLTVVLENSLNQSNALSFRTTNMKDKAFQIS